MNFGQALVALQLGSNVSRSGWNGKGMYLFLVKVWEPTVSHNEPKPQQIMAPFIAMKTADDKIVPWLASQTDLLANDWVIAL